MSGLTPTQVRAQLARMGWTDALSIHARDGGHSSRGKAPGIYRGFTVPDPNAPDLAMCLDHPAFQDARDALQSVRESVCEYRLKATAQTLLCAFHDRCGMQRQRNASDPIWLVPHAFLFLQKPEAMNDWRFDMSSNVTNAAPRPQDTAQDQVSRRP